MTDDVQASTTPHRDLVLDDASISSPERAQMPLEDTLSKIVVSFDDSKTVIRPLMMISDDSKNQKGFVHKTALMMFWYLYSLVSFFIFQYTVQNPFPNLNFCDLQGLQQSALNIIVAPFSVQGSFYLLTVTLLRLMANRYLGINVDSQLVSITDKFSKIRFADIVFGVGAIMFLISYQRADAQASKKPENLIGNTNTVFLILLLLLSLIGLYVRNSVLQQGRWWMIIIILGCVCGAGIILLLMVKRITIVRKRILCSLFVLLFVLAIVFSEKRQGFDRIVAFVGGIGISFGLYLIIVKFGVSFLKQCQKGGKEPKYVDDSLLTITTSLIITLFVLSLVRYIAFEVKKADFSQTLESTPLEVGRVNRDLKDRLEAAASTPSTIAVYGSEGRDRLETGALTQGTIGVSGFEGQDRLEAGAPQTPNKKIVVSRGQERRTKKRKRVSVGTSQVIPPKSATKRKNDKNLTTIIKQQNIQVVLRQGFENIFGQQFEQSDVYNQATIFKIEYVLLRKAYDDFYVRQVPANLNYQKNFKEYLLNKSTQRPQFDQNVDTSIYETLERATDLSRNMRQVVNFYTDFNTFVYCNNNPSETDEKVMQSYQQYALYCGKVKSALNILSFFMNNVQYPEVLSTTLQKRFAFASLSFFLVLQIVGINLGKASTTILYYIFLVAGIFLYSAFIMMKYVEYVTLFVNEINQYFWDNYCQN